MNSAPIAASAPTPKESFCTASNSSSSLMQDAMIQNPARNEIGELAIGAFVSHLSVVRKLTLPAMIQVKQSAV